MTEAKVWIELVDFIIVPGMMVANYQLDRLALLASA